jgi:hypothetical protein
MLVFWRISLRRNGGLAMKKKRFSVEQIVAIAGLLCGVCAKPL